MRKLPLAARLYVLAVILAGAGLLLYGLPRATFDRPLLLIALTALATATATLKVTLPLTTNRSTMSVSYAVDFASLLLLCGAGLPVLNNVYDTRAGLVNPDQRSEAYGGSLVATWELNDSWTAKNI